jgi:enoyl-CoA hydratase
LSEYETVIVERPRDGIALVSMNRPEKLNALDTRLWEELPAAVEALGEDADTRVIVLTGAGRGFCAGADLSAIADLPSQAVPGFMHYQERAANAIVRIQQVPKPTIAAVNGPAAGGGLAIALACDIRIAAPEARFNVAFVRLGLSGCDVGVSWLLPRVVGLGRASELMLTGRLIEAEEAERIGLVNAIADTDGLLDAAYDKAAEIARNSPFGLRLTKEGLRLGVDAPSIAAAVAIENRNQVLASRTEDMGEAVAAFLEKREPSFNNR